MEILICQSCGVILRSQGKSCKGCGALATRHTSTALSQVLDPSGSALSVSLQNDPLVLERTVNHIIYGKANGNGHKELYGNSISNSSIAAPAAEVGMSSDLPEASLSTLPKEESESSLAAAVSESNKPVLQTQETLTENMGSDELPATGATSPIISSQDFFGAAAQQLAETTVMAESLTQAKIPGKETQDQAETAKSAEPIESSLAPLIELAAQISAQSESSPQQLQAAKLAEIPVAEERKDRERVQHPHFPSNDGAAYKDPWQKTGVMDFFSANPIVEVRQGKEPGPTSAPINTPANDEAQRNESSFKPAQENKASISTEEAVARLLHAKASGNEREQELADQKSETETNAEDNDDEDDDDDNDEDNEREKKKDKGKDRPKRLRKDRFHAEKKEPDKSIEIMGRSFSKSTVITAGILAVVIGFPFMVLLSCVCSIVTSLHGGGQTPGQEPSAQIATAPAGLTGKWQFEYESIGSTTHGKGILAITQSGDDIEGNGIDSSGRFQLGGKIQGDSVSFNKLYIGADGKPAGKPISYAAKVSMANGAAGPVMQMMGKWELTKRKGYGWRAQIVTLSGRFGARLMQPGTGGPSETTTNIATMPSQLGQANPGHGAPELSSAVKDPKKAQNFFMQVAIGIIGIGVALAMVSLRFFGPSGLLNIWAKKEYIPSQFKSQHFKMVKEMGKPITTGGLPLGTREEWGLHQFWLPRQLSMPVELRDKNPHLFMIGAGATGKTRLMASMVAQDIESNDRAVVLVDSDGGLADLILNWVASRPNGAELAKRVIVVDPTYKGGQPLGYNPLEFPEDEDLQNAASALVSGFKAAYTEPPGAQSQWNQQTANILRNSSILLMANNKTLTDLPVLLSDNDFRDVLLERIEQLKTKRSEFITLVDAWTNYKRLARTDQWITWIEPILNRVQPMLSDPRIRSILTKEKSELDLKKIISDKKVLIVKIPQGQLDKNGNLLGSLMVAGVKQAALSLCARSKHKRRPCSLYLDEFESFIEKETFDAITTETRKLQIGFCGASKTLQTMPEDFRNKIIINCGIMAIFALAKKDGDMLGPQMFRVDGRKVKHQTIQNVFNKVNTSPQFELIMDEEKLNIDRVVGQEKRTYFCYRVGSVAGVFHMKAPEFADIDESQINMDLIDEMHANRQHDPELGKVKEDEELEEEEEEEEE